MLNIEEVQGAEIVLVDDLPENLELLSRLLEEQGHTVRVAINGELALRSIAVALPELILLDIMMPGMDGFEVCRRLKANPETADIPVIFITAMTELDNKLTGFRLGGADYVTKPFQAEEVLAASTIICSCGSCAAACKMKISGCNNLKMPPSKRLSFTTRAAL